MTDIQFNDLGDRRHNADILKVKAVAGMGLKARSGGIAGGLLEPPELTVQRRPVALGYRLALGAGVEFDHIGLDRACGVDLQRIRIDEQRNLDAGAFQLGDAGS